MPCGAGHRIIDKLRHIIVEDYTKVSIDFFCFFCFFNRIIISILLVYCVTLLWYRRGNYSNFNKNLEIN